MYTSGKYGFMQRMLRNKVRIAPATVSVEAVAVAVPVGRTAAALAVGEVLELVVEVFEGRVPHLGLDAHSEDELEGRRVCGWVRIQQGAEENSRGSEFTEEE